MAYLRPVLPKTAEAAEAFLNIDSQVWPVEAQPLSNHTINTFNPLMTRVSKDDIDAMNGVEKDPIVVVVDDAESDAATDQGQNIQVAVAQETKTDKQEKKKTPAQNDLDSNLDEPIAETIDFNDFSKIDLRVVKILKADNVKGTKKLLKLTLDLGGETRQVFAGVKTAYDPEDLVGTLTVMVANLKPRKMRFGVSEGMVLAAGPGGTDIFLLEPDEGAVPGMRIK
jgi:methionyl-tRNA synthetase